MSECPSDVMEGEAAVYFRNFVNVFGIVEVDERKLDRLSEHEPNQRDQTDADAGDESALRNVIAHFADCDPAKARRVDKDRRHPGFARRDHGRLEHWPVLQHDARFQSRSRTDRPARKRPQVFE